MSSRSNRTPAPARANGPPPAAVPPTTVESPRLLLMRAEGGFVVEGFDGSDYEHTPRAIAASPADLHALVEQWAAPPAAAPVKPARKR